MSIRIEIPWAYKNEMIPIFKVHQIGFIPTSGGPCSKLELPKNLARRNGTFYRVKCQSTSCTEDGFAPITPSCLRDGSNVSCAAHLSHCEQLVSFTMASGILLTTNHDVYGLTRDGDRVKLTGEGSLFVSWHEMLRVDVEGHIPKKFHRTFFSPEMNTAMASNPTEVLSEDLHYENTKHVWLDIYHGNRTMENDIIKRTSKEIELLKNGVLPKETHLTIAIWGSFGFLAFFIIMLIIFCWRRKRKTKTVYISHV